MLKYKHRKGFKFQCKNQRFINQIYVYADSERKLLYALCYVDLTNFICSN